MNLVVNGGFESGDTDPWTRRGYGAGRVEAHAANAHSGRFSLLVGNQGAHTASVQEIATEPGTRYRVTAFVFVPRGQAKAGLGLRVDTRPGGQRIAGWDAVSVDTWIKWEGEFTATTTKTAVVFDFNGKGTALIDDVSVARVGGAAAETSGYAVFGGHRYRLVTSPVTWDEARARCEKLGGHLVVITSRQEGEFLDRLLGSSAITKYHVGMRKTGGKAAWITGEAISWPAPHPHFAEAYIAEGTGAYAMKGGGGNRVRPANRAARGPGALPFICEWSGG